MPDLLLEARRRSGLFALRHFLQRLYQFLFDLIFPPQCGGCGRVPGQWCDSCYVELDAVAVQPIIREDPLIVGLVSTGAHVDKLQDAIHSLKYFDSRFLSEPLGHRAAACLQDLDWNIDLIVPVPMHAERRMERGYNQAELIAEVVAEQVNRPCVPQALSRQRPTRSQVGLNRLEREQNMEDAFGADAALVAGKSILLVDDVLTTGSTLRACAQAAVDAGAMRVYGLTISAAAQ